MPVKSSSVTRPVADGSLLPFSILDKVRRYVEGTFDPGIPALPAATGQAALRVAEQLIVLTPYEPTVSADDDGGMIVSARLDADRVIYVEVRNDILEAVLYSANDGSARVLAIQQERDLTREALAPVGR